MNDLFINVYKTINANKTIVYKTIVYKAIV